MVDIKAQRNNIDYSNLTVSEANGRWSAAWDRGGRHFTTDELYGCSDKRNYVQLKILLENEQGIVLPSEIALKSSCPSTHGLIKRTYEVDERFLGVDGRQKGPSKVLPYRAGHALDGQR